MYSKHAVVDYDNSNDFIDSVEKQRAKNIVRDCKRMYENTKNTKVQTELKQTANFMRTTFNFTDNDLQNMTPKEIQALKKELEEVNAQIDKRTIGKDESYDLKSLFRKKATIEFRLNRSD